MITTNRMYKHTPTDNICVDLDYAGTAKLTTTHCVLFLRALFKWAPLNKTIKLPYQDHKLTFIVAMFGNRRQFSVCLSIAPLFVLRTGLSHESDQGEYIHLSLTHLLFCETVKMAHKHTTNASLPLTGYI